jgi:acetyl esterase/lipase
MVKNAIIVLLLILQISLYADNATKTDNKSIKDISYLSKPTDDAYRNKMSKLDLYIPEGVTNFPTLVYFHGGGLTGGKRKGPTWMVKQGIAVVAVEYRLYPKCNHPDYINDCAAATSWVFKNIKTYGGDPKRIFIGGYSAGAYLTAMLAMDKKYLKAQGVDANSLAGALVQSGQMITHFTVRKQLGYQTKQGVCDENSPMYHIQKTPFPILLQCGDNDYPSRQEENHLFESISQNKFRHLHFPQKHICSYQEIPSAQDYKPYLHK